MKPRIDILGFYTLLIIFSLFNGMFAKTRDNSFISIKESSELEMLPIHFENRWPLVDITIDNTKIPLLFDTGAKDVISINLEKYPDVNVTIIKTDKPRYTMDAYGHTNEVRQFIIPNMTIGTMELNNVSGLEAKYHEDFQIPIKNGLIGRDLIKDYYTLLDYQNERVVLSPNKDFVEGLNEWNKVPFSYNDNGYIVKCRINGKVYNCLWDTGSNGNVIKKDIADDIMKEETENMMTINTSIEITDSKYTITDDFYVVNGLPDFFDVVLGTDFFEKHLVLIDTKNKIIYYK